MPEISNGPNSFRDPNASLGDADAVDDTRQIPAHGTEPEEATTGSVRARVAPGAGFGVLAWVIALIVVLLVAVWVLGLVR